MSTSYPPSASVECSGTASALLVYYGLKRCIGYVSELLTPFIAKDVVCAKLIYKVHGFDAWYGWQRKCKNRPLPDVIHCLNETSVTESPIYSVIMN
jgi:hypothetical protein